VSTMPAHSSVAKDTWDVTFHRLATKGGEKCGLACQTNLPDKIWPKKTWREKIDYR
jgi:hypothetical protein